MHWLREVFIFLAAYCHNDKYCYKCHIRFAEAEIRKIKRGIKTNEKK